MPLPLPKRLHPDFRLPNVKPATEASIDWDNPCSRGLWFCAPTIRGERSIIRDIAGGNHVSLSASINPESMSAGIQNNKVESASIYDLYKSAPITNGRGTLATDDWTITVQMRSYALGGTIPNYFGYGNNTLPTSSGGRQEGRFACSHNSFHHFWGVNIDFSTGVPVDISGKLQTLSYVKKGTVLCFYLDGVYRAQKTIAEIHPGWLDMAAPPRVYVGSGHSAATTNNYFELIFSSIHDRSFDAREVASFHGSLFQVLKPSRPYPYLAGGVGGGYTLAADNAPFSFSASAVGLAAARKISVLAGDFLFAGSNAALLSARQITIDPANFGVTPLNVSLLRAGVLSALSGGYALTGIDAGLSLAVSYTLTADPVPFVLSVVDSSLLVARALGVDSGDYVLSPVDAGLLVTRVLGADSAAYNLAALDASLLAARGLGVDSGAYVLSGTDATLAYGVSYKLTASPVAFSLAGIDGQLRAARLLPAATAGYTLAGGDAALLMARAISSDPASFGLTAADSALLADRALQALTQNYYLSGQAVNLIYSGMGVMQDLEGVITLISNTPKITLTSNTPVITVH